MGPTGVQHPRELPTTLLGLICKYDETPKSLRNGVIFIRMDTHFLRNAPKREKNCAPGPKPAFFVHPRMILARTFLVPHGDYDKVPTSLLDPIFWEIEHSL